MAKQVILAVAGAGKTYHICRAINKDEKNLILAYTHENIRNIKRELIEAHGTIPMLTNVMTFSSFVYRFLLRPYEPTILRHFGRETFKSKGVTTSDPPPQQIRVPGGRYIANRDYVPKNRLEHYVNRIGQYYCSNLSELILHVRQNRDTLVKRAALSINEFYDTVSIDEFQDFREYDYDLIVALARQIDNVLLVGDYYQHSVSAVNNTGKPFESRSGDVNYESYKQALKDQNLDVDDSTLKASRRCCREICDYVKQKLLVDIESANEDCGHIIWLEENIEPVLDNDSITKLVFNNANTYSFKAINWSYSKGDTISSVCVILTDRFETLREDSFECAGIPRSTINKLYVAMTRTKGDLYIIRSSVFRSIRTKYLKETMVRAD